MVDYKLDRFLPLLQACTNDAILTARLVTKAIFDHGVLWCRERRFLLSVTHERKDRYLENGGGGDPHERHGRKVPRLSTPEQARGLLPIK